jgi:hypothetical protein
MNRNKEAGFLKGINILIKIQNIGKYFRIYMTTDWRKDDESYVIRIMIRYSGIRHYQSDYFKEYKVIGLYWE